MFSKDEMTNLESITSPIRVYKNDDFYRGVSTTEELVNLLEPYFKSYNSNRFDKDEANKTFEIYLYDLVITKIYPASYDFPEQIDYEEMEGDSFRIICDDIEEFYDVETALDSNFSLNHEADASEMKDVTDN